MDLFGIYVGIVEKNSDPEKLGRLKVRVPHVYGIAGSVVGAVPMDDLPWAIPMGLPAGGSSLSGGMDWLPEPGDQVCVQFLDGEPEKPVWSWLMQTQDQAKDFKLHLYENNKGQVGGPKRGALTRYGHTVEWNAGSITMSTAHGYQVYLLDGSPLDGQITIRTPSAQFLMLDDETKDGKLFCLTDFYIQLGGELNALCADFRVETVTGDVTFVVGNGFNAFVNGDLTLASDAVGSISSVGALALSTEASLSLTSALDISMNYGSLLRLGTATEPYVLGNQLSAFLTSLLTWLSTHVHTSSSPGSPTSPPIVPPAGTVSPAVPLLLSTRILGE